MLRGGHFFLTRMLMSPEISVSPQWVGTYTLRRLGARFQIFYIGKNVLGFRRTFFFKPECERLPKFNFPAKRVGPYTLRKLGARFQIFYIGKNVLASRRTFFSNPNANVSRNISFPRMGRPIYFKKIRS